MPHAQHQPQLVEQTQRPRLGQFPQLAAEHAAIKLRQRGPRLCQGRQRLGGGRDRVLEKMRHLAQAELGRMTLVMKEDIGAGPTDELLPGEGVCCYP